LLLRQSHAMAASFFLDQRWLLSGFGAVIVEADLGAYGAGTVILLDFENCYPGISGYLLL